MKFSIKSLSILATLIKFPQRELHVGEIVAVRHSDLSRQVLGLSEKHAVVYYPKDGKEIIETLSLDDIRGYEEFCKGYLHFLGASQDFGVVVNNDQFLLFRKDRMS